MNRTAIFQYPESPHARRHGPLGYADYASYRDWLRDEFCFRCVFCLRREQWDRCCATFHIDHFVPQHVDPAKTLDYDNLLYVCASCNAIKGDLAVPDPSNVAYGDCVQVLTDGAIQPLNTTGELLIELLALNGEDVVRWRKFVLDTVGALCRSNREIYLEWVRFPDDLPDLSKRKPPNGNARPSGIDASWFATRERGELPGEY